MADAMKEEGWEFASHTWGHINVGEASLERLQTDTQKWLDYVKPLVGDTNVIIFALVPTLATGSHTHQITKNSLILRAWDLIFTVM